MAELAWSFSEKSSCGLAVLQALAAQFDAKSQITPIRLCIHAAQRIGGDDAVIRMLIGCVEYVCYGQAGVLA